MSSVEHWLDVDSDARWATELMDELLATTTRTSEELLARARELRAQAAATEIDGYCAGALKLAFRYEQAAAGLRAEH